jgi:hypothetical protein
LSLLSAISVPNLKNIFYIINTGGYINSKALAKSPGQKNLPLCTAGDGQG